MYGEDSGRSLLDEVADAERDLRTAAEQRSVGSQSEASDFDDLIRRVRAGDEAAAAGLVRRYEPAIRRAVRIRLADTRLARAFDSMDVCQSVLASFFVRAALGQYELDTPDQLLRLLATITRNKLADQARKQRVDRRENLP